MVTDSALEPQQDMEETIDRKGSVVSQKSGNQKGTRHKRRKTAQSTRFNTIAPQNSMPRDYINVEKSTEENF